MSEMESTMSTLVSPLGRDNWKSRNHIIKHCSSKGKIIYSFPKENIEEEPKMAIELNHVQNVCSYKVRDTS